MDFWLNCLILFVCGGLCFYVGYRVGFAQSEASDWEYEDNAEENE